MSRLDDMTRRLQQDPVVRQYCTHLQSSIPRNTEPWMAIGEQRAAAMVVLSPDSSLNLGNDRACPQQSVRGGSVTPHAH